MQENNTFIQPEPPFEELLYDAMKRLHPWLTVRLFSVTCLGRSEGYWSCILARKLPLANTALITLNDYLETQKIIHVSDPKRVSQMNDIQQMIATEIVRKFKSSNQASIEGWDKISQALRDEAFDEKYGYIDYQYMPFSWAKY